ncbi:hypothetical protein UA08_03477 [Talaromyces atroroseus]|uniref:Uncharacterized protein n=1 Tax=Talaromyces atroroseus TaxID=1441469 RepID=A0A225B3M5_TALAT|nr:hypothetical protein UA08_03477 [Talaromyces atroroseus]OKL61435.1 hypothetical protein UA08_03477 [Talaromyces atroroseus]
MDYIHIFSSGADERVHGVTLLHLGSLHANVDGIQALFDHHKGKATITEMVLSRDSHGRLPLHWAARGAHGMKHRYVLPRHEVPTHVVNTIKLLLSIDPNSVNSRDYRGDNALCRNQDGSNVLHLLGFTQNGEAIDPAIIERLVALGANVEDVDIRGNTPINQMALNLRQVAAIRALLSCGASMKIQNSNGDTPLHQAAKGRVFPLQDERLGISLDAKIRAQDEMMKVLEEASSRLDLMNIQNADGKTPRQLLEETRNGARDDKAECCLQSLAGFNILICS